MGPDAEYLAGVLAAVRCLLAVALLFLAEGAAGHSRKAAASGELAARNVFAAFAVACFVGSVVAVWYALSG